MKLHTNLVVDLNNVAFTIRRSEFKDPKPNKRKEAFARESIFKEVVSAILRFANKHRVDAIAIMCDSPNTWRKDLYPEYKAKDYVEDVYYDDTINAINLVKDFFKTCTNSRTYQVPKTEGDDLIAFMTLYSVGVNNLIMSSDTDFIQLLNERTTLYSLPQKKFRTTEDAEYDLFFKCIRGDANDNIFSAYPRVREAVLKSAWSDPYEMKALMETVRKDGKKVGDVYKFNKSLIDLRLQPTYILQDILDEFDKPNESNFSEFKIIKFYADNFLKQFSNSLNQLYRPLKGEVVFEM